ncbi:MAG: c-type cytochrome [Myxococcaceae bacterium]
MRRVLVALALLCAFALACDTQPTLPRREFLPEMVDSVPYDSFAPNPNTRDGKTLLEPPAGTIARGVTPFHYGSTPAEAERAGRELVSPVPQSPAALARGAAAFASYCSHCHGPAGLGDGPVIPKFPMPPSLTAARARALPDGRLFHIITRGQGLMPPHGAQVVPADRWKIIQHLRALQTAAGPLPPAPAAPADGGAGADADGGTP